MKSISHEDYLRMLESFAEEHYGSDDEPVYASYDEDAWMPSESPAKEKMLAARAPRNGQLDVTKYRKTEIQAALYKVQNIVVDSFLIRIGSYHGLPTPNKKEASLSMDLVLWETKYKTPTGNPCKMEYKLDPTNDTRFAGRKWLNYFDSSTGSARNVPTETVVEIVRWLQALKRMTVFL